MRQYTALIVAICLLISSCSAERIKPVMTNESLPTLTQVVAPDIHFETDFKIKPTSVTPIPVFSPAEANCLAKVIYYEARGESNRGKAAVGYVVLNRSRNNRYPNNICDVVKQIVYVKKKKVCQFSWYCQDGERKLYATITKPSYETCYKVALSVLTGTIDNPIGNAVSFHIRHLKNGWSNRMKLIATIGNHKFYIGT